MVLKGLTLAAAGVAAMTAAFGAGAATSATPLEIGIFSPVQLPWGDWDVCGVRLGAGYLDNRKVTGADFGLVNRVGTLTGAEFGAVNVVDRFSGVQFGAYNGAGWLLKREQAPSTGAQFGWVNQVSDVLTGLQAGVANLASGVDGVQVGLVNMVDHTPAGGWTFQIGFLNFNDDGYWPIMPLFGWAAPVEAVECVEVVEIATPEGEAVEVSEDLVEVNQ